MDTANENCRILLDVMLEQGVDTIVISPGSRNTPFIIGASVRDKFKKYVITDERTAAFMALGISMISRKPTMLVCTSGTALYNYAPAIAEAFYQHIPLIVITADRTSQWIDQDDSQTLRQYGALDKIVKRSYDIYSNAGKDSVCTNGDYEDEHQWYVNRIANEAYITSIIDLPGPVHINMQFGEPLNKTIPYEYARQRVIRYQNVVASIDNKFVKDIAEILAHKRVMVVAGFMNPDHRLNKAIIDFCALPNVVLMAEQLSNIHCGSIDYQIDSVLCKLTTEQKEDLRPDVVITIGGALVSRMLKEYIRSSNDTEHWTLSDTDVSIDSMQRKTEHFNISPIQFFSRFAKTIKYIQSKQRIKEAKTYRESWEDIRHAIIAENNLKVKNMPWCELSAINYIAKSIPPDYNVVLSNGTCVRYAQLLFDKIPHAVYGLRGVSGIDGGNATALGCSLQYKGKTILLTGDMSFAYCPDILNLKNLGAQISIIVINNKGGGIFRFIKTTRNLKQLEQYFCADQSLPIKEITEAYGWKYVCASNMAELSNSMNELLTNNNVLLEISVDEQLSAEILINYLSKE